MSLVDLKINARAERQRWGGLLSPTTIVGPVEKKKVEKFIQERDVHEKRLWPIAIDGLLRPTYYGMESVYRYRRRDEGGEWLDPDWVTLRFGPPYA